ncbi:MAG: flagellar hook-associated 2 domain protein, partial [Thermoleophilia bacterium]|nr:flagellar hook-associated 2 domain protein [Thermoleophilia bacterium]
KTIIAQLMSIESKPKLQLQWNQQLVAARKNAWTDLNTKLTSLKTAANTLLQASTWNPAAASSSATSFSSTSTDPSRLAATVTGTPTPGAYNVQVTQLAQGEISTSTATSGTIAANDTLTISQNGTTWNIGVAAGDSFATVVSKINTATGSSGVQASLSGGAIKLASTTTGATSAFSVTSAGGTAAALGFSSSQSAQDAFFSVDGVSQTSASNFGITTAVAGLSVNLTGTTNATITVAQTDSSGKSPQQIWEDSVVQKVKDFAASYNSVQQTVYQKTQAESKVTTPADKKTGLTLSEYLAGPMARNTSFANVATQLRAQTGGQVSGLPAGSDMLASIGVTSGTYAAGQANGLLTVDETKLRAALQAPSGATNVQNVLGNVGTASSGIAADDGIARRVTELVTSLTSSSGSVGTAISGAGSDDRRLQDSIDRATSRLTRREQYYNKMYAALEVSLGKLQSQSSWLSSQLAGLSANNG